MWDVNWPHNNYRILTECWNLKPVKIKVDKMDLLYSQARIWMWLLDILFLGTLGPLDPGTLGLLDFETSSLIHHQKLCAVEICSPKKQANCQKSIKLFMCLLKDDIWFVVTFHHNELAVKLNNKQDVFCVLYNRGYQDAQVYTYVTDNAYVCLPVCLTGNEELFE